jgi:hypothetical protein
MQVSSHRWELAEIAAAIGVSVIEVIMLLIPRSLYTIRYVLKDHELAIQTTKLIGGNKRIPLD